MSGLGAHVPAEHMHKLAKRVGVSLTYTGRFSQVSPPAHCISSHTRWHNWSPICGDPHCVPGAHSKSMTAKSWVSPKSHEPSRSDEGRGGGAVGAMAAPHVDGTCEGSTGCHPGWLLGSEATPVPLLEQAKSTNAQADKCLVGIRVPPFDCRGD